MVGVITLSSLLFDPVAKLALYRQGLGFILGLMPYLQTYAAAFFALPLIRMFVDGRRNSQIEDRNDNRLQVRRRVVVVVMVGGAGVGGGDGRMFLACVVFWGVAYP